MTGLSRIGNPVGVRAVDPGARRLTRALAGLEPWARPVRWLLAGVAGIMGLELVPYALWWEGSPHVWAVGGLVTAGSAWLVLPRATHAAHRQAVVSAADLGPRSDAAAALVVAWDARLRFEAAAGRLDDARRWVRDARRRLDETTWSVAVRARELARLEAALADVRTRAEGPRRRAEEDRLDAELGAHRRVVEELAAELVHLADVAERTATAISGLGPRSRPAPELSEAERGTLDSLRWFRTRLEAVEEAWLELNAGPSVPRG